MIYKYDFSAEKLPETYIRNNKPCYLDPVRKRLVQITPEETVRQQIISHLLYKLHIPSDLILVEENMKHYGANSNRRADIVIHKPIDDESMKPICVIECKRKDMVLDEKALNQAFDYGNNVLCDYVIITNGFKCIFYRYNESRDSYDLIEPVKSFRELINDDYTNVEEDQPFERIPFAEISEFLKTYAPYQIGKDTNHEIAKCLYNFYECLVDDKIAFKKTDFRIFRIIKDLGIRLCTYGNHGGGEFSGLYRSFLVEYNGNREIVSVSVSDYVSFAHPEIVRTAISVAIDIDKIQHHSLQLVDRNITYSGNTFYFNHDGRIGISNKGSGKVAELKALLNEKYPFILDENNKICLGSLNNNRLFDINDKEITDIIENLISYALIRDEYREIVKARYK